MQAVPNAALAQPFLRLKIDIHPLGIHAPGASAPKGKDLEQLIERYVLS